jgi:hypothetical protein
MQRAGFRAGTQEVSEAQVNVVVKWTLLLPTAIGRSHW